MNRDVVITCAITGDDARVTGNPNCPVTPAEIAASAVDAAKAGAAIVHIHVRDPQTGAYSSSTEHYREVVRRIRESGTDAVINLTAGMGGYLVVNDDGLESGLADGTDFVSQEDRLGHVTALCNEGDFAPDVATLDCGTLNFGNTNRMYGSPPGYLRRGAEIMRDLGVKPELEVFDTGNLWFVLQMIDEGLIEAPAMIQLCSGIPWGMPVDMALQARLAAMMPQGAFWSAFGIGRMQMPMVAASILMGGHVRVGLEDNLYLEKGVYATNAQLVEKARGIIEAMGGRVRGPEYAREVLSL